LKDRKNKTKWSNKRSNTRTKSAEWTERPRRKPMVWTKLFDKEERKIRGREKKRNGKL